MSEEIYEEVKMVIDTYIKSAKTLDFELMKSIAHQDSRIFLGNTDTSKNLPEHLGDENKRYSAEKKEEMIKKMKIKLLTLQVDGTIAFAKIRVGGWIDYHNLVKTSEGWKLVDKVSHKVE
ncbi:MAG: nuclear transport factor 2 family protein [Asgard group archaeon]|nr:nuclear transport factor 2 family protein [Asgard group archaeon]